MNMYRQTDREFPRAKEQTLILLTVTSGDTETLCFSFIFSSDTRNTEDAENEFVLWSVDYNAPCFPFLLWFQHNPSYRPLSISHLIHSLRPICHYPFSGAVARRSSAVGSCQPSLNWPFRKAEVIQGTTKSSLRPDLYVPPAKIHNGGLISEQAYAGLFSLSVNGQHSAAAVSSRQ